jgi:Zn finger protein HypA/HybF involved in hydrogenase expression
MTEENQQETIEISNPTLTGIKCPECGSEKYIIKGTGSLGASLGKQFLFGGVGNMVSSSRSKNDFELKPVKFKCKDCKKDYETLPNDAEEDELLEQPCTITFKRLSGIWGAAIRHQVFLNGIKIGTVKNGSEITFQTRTKENTIFVTDMHGVAFNDTYEFTAESGGEEYVKFKRKFKK